MSAEPSLKPVPIAKLRPTQMTLGLREVEQKREHWRGLGSKKKIAAALGAHMIPVVLGPGEAHFVVDHHHLARALSEEGIKDVLVNVIADLSMVREKSFWHVMDARKWVYPFDAKGARHEYRDLPRQVGKMEDDPFRSLAGELRRAGGFAKDTTPYSEFLWADFLRLRLARKLVQRDFDAAINEGLQLARSREAIYLPGWCGASND